MNVGAVGLPLDRPSLHAHSSGMRRLHRIILTVSLLQWPLFAQTNPHQAVRDALASENAGNFEPATASAKLAVDSGQLAGAELGRAYIILGVAEQGVGNLIDAQIAYEHALQILKGDPQHLEEYAAALENYAGYFTDLGQLEIAAPLWSKAFHLRQQMGAHTGLALALIHQAGVALSRKKIHEARDYLTRASDEMKLAHDLADGDVALFFEMKGWLGLAEGHPSEAVAGYGHALEICTRAYGEQHWLCGWDRLLCGKGYAQAGRFDIALDDMRKGLTVLEQTLGRRSPKYLAAQIAYSQVLDRVGSHAEAAQMRTSTEQARQDYFTRQCARCTIPVWAFR
jgi:tetratricopeptide (TPR) repeat protein